MHPFLVRAGRALALLVPALGTCAGAAAATLDIHVRDRTGVALEHAVASLHDGVSRRAAAGTRAVIDQRDKRFAPTVVALQSGTEVAFPNSDDVRHHVYSFSHPNAFELKLYHGEPSRPVRFDDPGTVVLGCNIHDGMVGYLQVVDTPWFATSDAAGDARIEDVPARPFTLQVWHPDLGTRYLRRDIVVPAGSARVIVTIDPAALERPTPAAANPRRDRPGERVVVDPTLSRELQSLFDTD